MKNKKTLLLIMSIALSTFCSAQAICDDFTDISAYPLSPFGAEELIGYTQGGTHPINTGIGATGDFNGDSEFFPGMYIVYGPVDFDFDGTTQEARLSIYGWFGEGTEDGFSVNGSSSIQYDDTFPLVIDGITVELEDSPEDFGSWDHAYLVLSGDIETVTLEGVEFGVTDLCVEPLLDEDLECDNFTNTDEWPNVEHLEPGIIGYSQGGDFPITNGTYTYTWVNNAVEGIYSIGDVNYAFDGSNQTAQFTIKAFYGLFDEVGFNVNGSDTAYMDTSFPITLDGINITLDSIETIDVWTYTHLTFTGEIDDINIIGFESAVTDLCVEPLSDIDESCDDFTNITDWPESELLEEGIIGYSQDGSYPITNGPDAYTWINNSEDGIFSTGPVNYAFDGSNQSAQFTIYGFYEQFSEMGFNVNGSTDAFMDASFPITLDGINITLDSIEMIGSWTYTHLTFTGEIDNINIIGFESGVTQLCIEKDSTASITQENLNYSLYPNPIVNNLTVTSNTTINKLSIYALSGELIYENVINTKSQQIEFSAISKGIYIIELTFEDGSTISKKLVKQ